MIFICNFSVTVTKNLSERRGAKSSEMSPVPMRSIGQTTKAHQHQQNRMSQVLQVPTVNLYPSRKKGLTKDHVTFSECLRFSSLGSFLNEVRGRSCVPLGGLFEVPVCLMYFIPLKTAEAHYRVCFRRTRCLLKSFAPFLISFLKTANCKVLAPNTLLLYCQDSNFL